MSGINPTYRDRVRYTLSHKEYGSKIITEPEGWDTSDKEYSRHKKYKGVITKFSNNLRFVEDGADYINYIRDTYDVNAEIWLKREERHPYTDVWTLDYDGVLDLSTWEMEDFAVKVKFNSSGLETEIKARESEKVEIERNTSLDGHNISSLSTHNIEFEGRKIFLQTNFIGDNSSTVKTEIPHRKGSWGEKAVPFGMKLVNKSDELFHEPVVNQFHINNPDASLIFYGHNDREKEHLLSAKGKFTVKLVSKDEINHSAFLRLVLVHYSGGSDYNIKETYIIHDDLYPTKWGSRTINFDFKQNLYLEQGDSLGLFFWTGADNGNWFDRGRLDHVYENLEIDLDIQENSFFEKTSSKIILAHELGERLLEIITGRKGVFYSEYLGRKELGYEKDGEGSLKGYSCGHWLRGFDKLPINDSNKYKPFTTSFKDFLEDLMATENVGMGIEKIGFKERIVIRPIEDFYVDYVTIKLPYQVSNVKRKSANKHYYSSVLIGCEKGWENEEAMGLDEYNTQSNFFTPIIRVKNEFKQLTKYIYASYAGEFIRRKPKSDYPNLDHRNDKAIFPFALKREYGYFSLRKWQDDFDSEPKGVYSPETAYNLKYSPVNLLLKHGRTIASSLKKHLKDYLRFGSSEGNIGLKTKQKNKKEFSENGDVLCSDLGVPYHLPEEIEFEHEFNYDIKEQLEGTTIINGKEVQNIYGIIEFINEKGEVERGRFEKLKPNSKAKWTVLKAS
ncbi:hypothetical protein [Tenacibaculum caenipelagi]|uniref:Uncharacterized protein n=1 Tax=Tenacibaculum caenipelagi TaxID=1325435 RepID=A0A4R6TCT4_9FLAO|nr:hypothetical protein [Tenacibaculum caenipelagi]TDQ27625.1 hypothetical protein DFQ07_1476 [Tenacibaculum caenipelagi]